MFGTVAKESMGLGELKNKKPRVCVLFSKQYSTGITYAEVCSFAPVLLLLVSDSVAWLKEEKNYKSIG